LPLWRSKILNLKALNHLPGESGKDILNLIPSLLFALCCSKSYNTINGFWIPLNGLKRIKRQILNEKHPENSFALHLTKM